MNRFVQLFQELDGTTKTNAKVAAMIRYFQEVAPGDAVWGLYLLTGRRSKRPVNTTKLTDWAIAYAGIPSWLFMECYDAIGDLAETMAKLTWNSPKWHGLEGRDRVWQDHPEHGLEGRATVPEHGLEGRATQSLAHWLEVRYGLLRNLPEDEQRRVIEEAWAQLDEPGRFIWNKLITGNFRVGVSQDLVIRALAEVSGHPASTIAHRLMGDWSPTEEFFESLLSPDEGATDPSHPYPFCLAHPLEGDPASLGDIEDWQAEWKWDGIRCQLIRRAGKTFLWSRGEEAIAERFPEVAAVGESLPDGTVLDGEIMAWKDGPLPFAELQKRIGRKIVGKKLLVDVPCALVSFDLLEWGGKDMRKAPLAERRRLLESLPKLDALVVPETLDAESWETLAALRQTSRERFVEGLMLKRKDSPYVVGRKKGSWWKWKIEPFTVDCVLMYAQRGSGIRASLYTDYTFGIWKEDALVPFAKAYSGLDNREIAELDNWIRGHTLEKFGPVRTVEAFHVFELAFEGIQLSKRHKSGIAVRFPRILRWRKDKKPEDADTFERVSALLNVSTQLPVDEDRTDVPADHDA